MDKRTFVDRLEAVKRRKILLIRISLSVLFVILATSMWMSKAHPNDGVRPVFKSASIFGFMIVVYACVASLQRMGRRLGLQCPHCDARLTGLVGQKAAASETCFHCGQRLF
jgi:uncharacterized membrane protein YkgB